MLAAFLAAGVALALVTAAAVWMGSSLPRADHWVHRAQSAIGRLALLRGGIDRIRGAQTDYLLTGDAHRLKAYEVARKDLAVLFSAVRETAAEHPTVDRELAEVSAQAAEWLGRAEAAVARKRAGQPLTRAMVESDRRAVSDLRDYVENLRRIENRVLAERIDEMRENAALALWLTLAGAAVSLAVLIWGATTSLRDLDRRLALERMRVELGHHVNHELRGPCAAVRMAFHLLENGPQALDPDQRQIVEAGVSSAEHLKRMVDDLLDVTRLETGKLRVELDALDAVRILEECRLAAAAAASLRGVNLRRLLPQRLPVRGDAVRLRQVVGNLLDNAVKFTPPGGTVTLSAEARDGKARVWVEDTGPGIPESDLERVFDRLYQSARTAAQGAKGLGLGLAVSRELVERHGGRIWAENGPAGGARIIFELPLAA